MKRFVYAVMTVALCASALADSPTFVTSRMMDRRNGLTDAQYETLWAMGRNPQIKPNVARDWVFRASRYQNVTNWLDVCGKTNDFAALSYELQGENFGLTETNTILVATNRYLRATCISLAEEVNEQWANYTNQLAQTAAFSNLCVIVSAQAEAAQAKITRELAELREEKADLEAKIADSKYILLRPWLKTKLAAVEARIARLEALTNS